LALNPDQSQALSAKALVLALYDHDWGGAGELYQRAMRSRDNIVANIGYGAFITHAVDRPDLSVRMYLEAEKRDPLHAGIKANLGTFLLYVGDTETSIKKANEALELEPDHIFAFIALMDAYTAKGQYEEVKVTIERIPPDLLQNPNLLVRVGLYYAAVGQHENAFEIYRDMVEHMSPAPIINVSNLALALGRTEEALDYMEFMVEKKSWTIPWIRRHYHQNAMLKDHPRYLALLKQVGLDDKSVKELQDQLSL
jgi:tetratricopeptide (TPR) repeat protein